VQLGGHWGRDHAGMLRDDRGAELRRIKSKTCAGLDDDQASRPPHGFGDTRMSLGWLSGSDRSLLLRDDPRADKHPIKASEDERIGRRPAISSLSGDCCSSPTIRKSAAPPRSNATACTATNHDVDALAAAQRDRCRTRWVTSAAVRRVDGVVHRRPPSSAIGRRLYESRWSGGRLHQIRLGTPIRPGFG
jgi:hypothetical protein